VILVLDEITAIRQKAENAITDPFAPPPTVSELAVMYGINRLPTFEEYKYQFLKNAPPAVVNFYKNLRTPQGAQKFMKLMLWYPELLQSLIERSKMFVPFVLPSDEIEVGFEWEQKRQAVREQIFDRAMKAYLDIQAVQANRQQLLANSLIERVTNITDPADWVRAFAESTRFWGTPYAPAIYGAFITSGVRILRRNPSEETKNFMKSIVPAEIWHSIETQASDLQKFQGFSASLIQAKIDAARKYRDTLKLLKIELPELDAAIARGEQAIELLGQVPREELPNVVNQILNHLDTEITKAMTAANTRIGKSIGDLVTTVRQLLSQIGRGTTQVVSSSLANFRTLTGLLGGRTGQIMGDDKGVVTFGSWRTILKEVGDTLDKLIEIGAETGAYFVESLRILKSMVEGKSALLDFSEGLYNNLQKTLTHPDFLKLPPKAKIQNIQLQRAILSLQDFKKRMERNEFKFKFDALHRYFNDTRQLLAALKSAGIGNVIKTEDGKKLLRDALAMVRNLSAPGVDKILGPEITQKLLHDVIDKDISHALQIISKPANQINQQDVQFIDQLVSTLLLELANAYDAMSQLLTQQGILPTAQSLPYGYNLFGGVPQQFEGEGKGGDPMVETAVRYLLAKELQRQMQGEQSEVGQPEATTSQYSPGSQTGKSSAGRTPRGKSQVVISPEEVVFGTKFGEGGKEEKKRETKAQPKKETQAQPKKETKSETPTKPTTKGERRTQSETRALRAEERYTPQVRVLR